MNVIAARFIDAVAQVLDTLFWVYTWVVIVRALISWVNPDPWNPIVQTLNRLTDPLLEPIRRKMFRMMSYGGLGIDLSPMILIVAVYLLGNVLLVSMLHYIAMQLR